MAMARPMPQREGGGMSERCAFGTKLLNVSGAYPERRVGVEITGQFKDFVDTRRFSLINDKESTPSAWLR